jgi:hypothetical protein
MPGPLSRTEHVLVLGVLDLADLHPDLGQDARLLAGVQGIVDGFLDRGQQGLARIVEAEHVAVLGEEVGDRDLALLLGHRLGVGCGTGHGPPFRKAFSSTGVVWSGAALG